MQIKSSRPKSELMEVLREPKSEGPEIAYWVFSDVTEGKWENMTVTTPGRYGKEYPKTYGHYHTTTKEKETYKLGHGEGVFMLQKKHYEDGVWFPEKVDVVYLVKVTEPGETVIVPEEFGHSWSNTGETPLITFDDWKGGHSSHDYKSIRDLQGMAFYLIDDEGKPKPIPNPKYKDHPEPQWVTADEFNLMVK